MSEEPKSDTPRTDAVAFSLYMNGGTDGGEGVSAKFARQLERELSALRANYYEAVKRIVEAEAERGEITSVSETQTKIIAKLEKQLSEANRRLEVGIEALAQYGQHESSCILSRWEAGRPIPTKAEGYEMKYGGAWYEVRPTNHTPECECGLNEALREMVVEP